MVKVGHNGPEETTYAKQGVGLRIDMITDNMKYTDLSGLKVKKAHAGLAS